MLGQRLRELSQSDTVLAHELAREAMRNDEIVDITVQDTCVTVEKTKFKGTHQVRETDTGWEIQEKGQYKTLIEGVDLTFTIRTVDDQTLARIEEALPDRSEETNMEDKVETQSTPSESAPQPQSTSTPGNSESVTGDNSEDTPTASPATPVAAEGSGDGENIVDKVRQLLGK